MARHTLSHADEFFAGAAQENSINGAQRGLRVYPVYRQIWTDPVVFDADGLVLFAPAGPGDIPLTGALVVDGVGVLDFARTVSVDTNNVGNTTQTVTIVGTDIFGRVISEDIALNGQTVVEGNKAFKTVTSISIDIVVIGSFFAGTGDGLGLESRLIGFILQPILKPMKVSLD